MTAPTVLITLVAAGCGYTHQPLFSDEVHSVAVPLFENRSFYRGLEREVTEALIKEIELRTPYKVAPAERADTVLRGTITAVDQSRMSRRRDGGLPLEEELQIRVNVEWQDLRSGRTLRERRGLTAVGRYVPAREIGETHEIAQYAASQRLARQIVGAMGEAW